MISPARFNEMVSVVQRPSKSRSAKLWEICSGTGVLSAAARKRNIPHMPPIDHRYGWHTARSEDQIMILHGLLNIGVLCLFAAPNCALWGSMTRGLPASVLEARRAREFPGLRFLALCCLVQVLLNRHFIVENSWASQIFSCSPLHILDPIGLITTKVDQCMYGAELEGQAIRKSSMFVSDVPLEGLAAHCDHSHNHLQLRGSGPQGSRTASAARYPHRLCEKIIDCIQNMGVDNARSPTPAQDGGSKPSSTSSTRSMTKTSPEPTPQKWGGRGGVEKLGTSTSTKLDQVFHRLRELRGVAASCGLEALYDELVVPWMAGASCPVVSDSAKVSMTPLNLSSTTSSTSTKPLEGIEQRLIGALETFSGAVAEFASYVKGAACHQHVGDTAVGDAHARPSLIQTSTTVGPETKRPHNRPAPRWVPKRNGHIADQRLVGSMYLCAKIALHSVLQNVPQIRRVRPAGNIQTDRQTDKANTIGKTKQPKETKACSTKHSKNH